MSKPQLVIPMSGLGTRFIEAGYRVPKPLIPVMGKPIIQHILEMYEDWDSILFIVNEDHFNDPGLDLRGTLDRLSPNADIYPIPAHKLGPSHAVWKAKQKLKKDRPIVINYCDFAGKFDLAEYEKKLHDFDSVLLTYTGFHPHMLRSQKFAYIKRDNSGALIDIQEKSSYTDYPMQEEASAGAYGFRNFEILEEALSE